MTATLEQVREAIATAVTSTTGLRMAAYLEDQANAPIGMLDVEGPEQIAFSDAGAQSYTFTLLYIDLRTSERAAQKRCDELRDPFHARSLKRAIDDSTELDALVGADYASVGQPRPLTPVRIGVVDYLAAEFPIEVVIHQEES